MRLKGKIAIVTGGAKGIGEAIARLFAEEGAAVVVADFSQEGSDIAARIGGMFVRTDVSDSSQVQALMKKVKDTYGRLDILVNNAGVVEKTDVYLEDETFEEWMRVQKINLYGNFYTCKYALPMLRETRGSIVNIASMSGLVATRFCSGYCASKAGVIGLTRAISCDYGKYGVRAVAVCPAACETPMMKDYFAAFTPEEVAEKVERLSGPIGRMSQPVEIAKAVLFAASGDASYVSGIALPVDGGYTSV